MIAWYGDMQLPGHFLRLVMTGGLDAVVSFGEPIAFGPGEDRKQVADRCYAAVTRHGRRSPSPLAGVTGPPSGARILTAGKRR